MLFSAANLARLKQTSQSSRVDNSPYGVDGIYQTNFGKGPCTHTASAGEMNPWWRVDLGRVEPVSEVYLVNRGNCSCKEKLWNIDVRVGMGSTHELSRVFLISYSFPIIIYMKKLFDSDWLEKCNCFLTLSKNVYYNYIKI